MATLIQNRQGGSHDSGTAFSPGAFTVFRAANYGACLDVPAFFFSYAGDAASPNFLIC